MDGWHHLVRGGSGPSPRGQRRLPNDIAGQDAAKLGASAVKSAGRPLLCVSDICGDLAALEAILSAVAKVPLAGILALGDHVVGGPQPFEVWMRLQSLGAHMTCGPADIAVASLDRLPEVTPRSEAEERRLALFWHAREALGDVVARRLGELPTTLVVSLDDTRGVMALHGSPSDDDVLDDDDDLADRVAAVAEDVLVTGGLRQAYARRVNPPAPLCVDEDGKIMPSEPMRPLLVVNAGSVVATPPKDAAGRRRMAQAVLVGAGDDGEVHAWGAEFAIARSRSRRAS
jgi:hypothetical protein